jgi:hypothetical protein
MRWFSVLSALMLIVVVGCSDDGSGGSGAACSTPGSTSECFSGAICTNLAGDGNQCLQMCVSQADCPANQNCNGIANTNLKSCQPG